MVAGHTSGRRRRRRHRRAQAQHHLDHGGWVCSDPAEEAAARGCSRRRHAYSSSVPHTSMYKNAGHVHVCSVGGGREVP